MTFKGQNPHVRDGKPGGRLAERTLALVNIPSVSRAAAEAMAYVRSELPLERVRSSDDVLFATSKRESGRPLVLLAGHVDTVPAQDNLPGRIEDGAVIDSPGEIVLRGHRVDVPGEQDERPAGLSLGRDRKSTRLNSSHMSISYAVFCLKKKKRSFRSSKMTYKKTQTK